MSAENKLTARSALSVLRNAPYRRYIIGSAISDTGAWMQVMAQPFQSPRDSPFPCIEPLKFGTLRFQCLFFTTHVPH